MPEMTTVAWDLSDLFGGVDDPSIEAALDQCLEKATGFAEEYRGKIVAEDLTAQLLRNAIEKYEAIAQHLVPAAAYSSLIFAADTSKPEHGALMQHIQERQTEISIQLMFFELELMAAKPEIIERVLQDEVMAPYRHFVHASRLFREHRLSEPE